MDDSDEFDRVEYNFDFDDSPSPKRVRRPTPLVSYESESEENEMDGAPLDSPKDSFIAPYLQLQLESMKCVDLSSDDQSEYNLLQFLSAHPDNIVIQVKDVPSFTDPNDRYNVQVPFSQRAMEMMAPLIVQRNSRIICARRIPFRIFSSRDVQEINKPLVDENLKTYRHFMLNFRGNDEYLVADDESQYKFYKPENRFFVIQNYHSLSANELRFWDGIMLARTGRPLDRDVKFIRNETLIARVPEVYFNITGYTVEDYLYL
jgi:hypothetical protein